MAAVASTTTATSKPACRASMADPATQRVETPHFRLEVQRSFRGNRLRQQVVFEPLVPELPASELSRLMDDLGRLDRAIGGTMAVAKAELKEGGLLGLGAPGVGGAGELAGLAVEGGPQGRDTRELGVVEAGGVAGLGGDGGLVRGHVLDIRIVFLPVKLKTTTAV